MKNLINQLSRHVVYSGIFFLAISLAGCSDNALDSTSDRLLSAEGEIVARAVRAQNGPGALTVMTRNVYVGTDVDAVLGGGNPIDAVATLLATNFPERAQAFAAEIAAADPHIIGLQEISEIVLESPLLPEFGLPTPFELDYLDILMATLAGAGLDYYVVGEIMDTDATINLPGFYAELRDYDVLLARSDVESSNIIEANYAARLVIPGFEVIRGYVAADVNIKGREYRVVTTHLEPFIPGYPAPQLQVQQAEELMLALASETKPTILVGDMNTHDFADATGDAYRVITDDFVDLWARNTVPHSGAGFTCCQDTDLLNVVSDLDTRFDLIFFDSNDSRHGNDGLGSVSMVVIGEEHSDKTPSGLWPSDHAGVVAAMKIPYATQR